MSPSADPVQKNSSEGSKHMHLTALSWPVKILELMIKCHAYFFSHVYKWNNELQCFSCDSRENL
jgi:hypothetical protein